MKKAMKQDVEETLVESFDPGFQAANPEIKSAFFRFLKMVLIGIIHERTLATILIKNPYQFISLRWIYDRPSGEGAQKLCAGRRPRRAYGS